jgi:Hypothetical glycosyl hydrolase 6/Beta-galactosidase trimerisation domain
MQDNISRRLFLGACGAAGATVAIVDASIGAAPAVAAAPTWVDRPMRWAQLTLVEDDPGAFDLPFWLDYFHRTHSDAACLSAGGCVAYYPTDVPFHHRSRWLADRDPFGDLVKGCRNLGMNVIARTDPHATYDDVRAAHPDWIAVDGEGRPRRHWASPEMWITCALGPYNFDFMTAVHKEVMTRYRVDGIFINRWSGSGMCYCEHCRTNFRAATGHELPRTDDPHNPARQAYVLWEQQRLFELWRLWDAEVRKINADSRVIPNTGGGATSPLDMKVIGELAPTLFADRQARSGLMPPWANGKAAKEYRATMGRKPVGGIFSMGVEEAYRWKDSVQSEAEIRVWFAEGVANGLRPWFTKFSGTLRDRRWLGVIEDLYRWHHQAERYLRNEAPLARVALVYSQQTAWFYGGPRARQKVEDHSLGWCQALIEARVPFEMVHERLLDADHLDRFKTLILPNIAVLSDEQCRQLGAFVDRGGSLVATYETSLYDERGARRSDFGLADLFGASFRGGPQGPMRNAYLRLEGDPRTGMRHPILAGLDDAPRIIHGTYRLDVKPNREFRQPPLTLIPSYPDLPMEMVYPRVPKTDIAELYVREVGIGRVVYFPWDIDRVFWEVLAVDHGNLLQNAVDWATNEEPPVRVTGPGVLDVTVWRQAASMTIHLVNLTNPMMMKGPFRELIPVGEQRVVVKLPAGAKASNVHLLVAVRDMPVEQVGTRLTVAVPSIRDHEVLAIDFV